MSAWGKIIKSVLRVWLYMLLVNILVIIGHSVIYGLPSIEHIKKVAFSFAQYNIFFGIVFGLGMALLTYFDHRKSVNEENKNQSTGC